MAITDFELLDWGEIYERGELQYVIMGEEICPDTERSHFQGFLQFKNETTLREFKNMISKKTHIEWRVGTVEQNINYCKGLCKKKDFKENKWEEWGRPSLGKQGFRTDLESVMDSIKDGMGLVEISLEYPGQWVRYSNGIKGLWHNHLLSNAPTWRDVITTVYVGRQEAGKTILISNDDLFRVNCENKQEFLFDGYMGEGTILLDDFYGQIKYHYMLRILDGYPLPLNIKNGRTTAVWNKIFITSNQTPALWYSAGLKSLRRRINFLYEVRKGNTELFSLGIKEKKNYETDDEDSDTDSSES